MHFLLARRLYFGLQKLRGEPISSALADVRKSEFMSLGELQQIQAKRQLAQLRFAVKHVPYYREAYAPYLEHITHSKSYDEVATLMFQLPILSKSLVTENKAALTAENASTLATYPDKTSGSSGTPLTFPCDQNAWAYRHALMYRNMEAFGVQIGEPYALFFGLHWNRRTQLQVKLRDWIFNRTRISAYKISSDRLDAHLTQILAKRPTHFVGYPSAIYDFCSMLFDRGLDQLAQLKLKAVFTTAEPLRDFQKNKIEEVTKSRCVNQYGAAESGLIATECPHGKLHINIEAVWLQIDQPENSTGEIIVTDMMLRAFPLIRYQLGDDITCEPGRCSCGRAHPMLKSVEGRSGEFIILPNQKRINPNLPSYIFKPLSSLGVIRRYRFIQKNNVVTLLLIVNNTFNDGHLQVISAETRKAFGEDINLVIKVVDQLPPLANAKHRDYVCLDD